MHYIGIDLFSTEISIFKFVFVFLNIFSRLTHPQRRQPAFSVATCPSPSSESSTPTSTTTITNNNSSSSNNNNRSRSNSSSSISTSSASSIRWTSSVRLPAGCPSSPPPPSTRSVHPFLPLCPPLPRDFTVYTVTLPVRDAGFDPGPLPQ